MKRILLIGRADHDNFGDSLMFAFYCQHAIDEGCEVNIYGASEIFIKRLTDIGLNVNSCMLDESETYDYAIFIGGGYFGEPDLYKARWHRNFNKQDFFLKASRELVRKNIPYSILGVEVGPLSNKITRTKIKEILINANDVVVRNIESSEFVKQSYGIECEVYRDVVLYESKEFLNREINKNARVDFTIHATGKFFKNNIVSKIFRKKLANYIKENEFRTVRILFDQTTYSGLKVNVDKFISENRLESTSIVQYTGIKELMTFIAESEYIVTTKLHLGMVGLSCGSKVFCISNMRKNIRFYRELFENRGIMSLQSFLFGKLKNQEFVSRDEVKVSELESSKLNLIKFKDIIKR